MKKVQLRELDDIDRIRFANSEYNRILSTQKGRILTVFGNEGLILIDAAYAIDWDVLELDAILSDTSTAMSNLKSCCVFAKSGGTNTRSIGFVSAIRMRNCSSSDWIVFRGIKRNRTSRV